MFRIFQIVTIFVFASSSYGQVYQRIKFFSEPNLAGISETLDNTQEIASPIVASAKSFCSELGLWQLTILERDVGGTTSSEVVKVYGGNYGPSYCVNSIPVPNGKTWEIKSAVLLGERDLTVPTLTVFDNAGFLGPPTAFTSPEETFELELTFNSYFITGSTNWAIFSGNLTGDETCLKSLTDGGATHGARAEAYPKPSLTIMSYRQGCAGDGDSPAPRPPGGSSGSDTVLLHNLLLSFAFILASGAVGCSFPL